MRYQPKTEISIGDKLGVFTVIGLVGRRFVCKCECGAESVKRRDQLVRGKNSYCSSPGCVRAGKGGLQEKHPREYSVWSDMRSRCVNKEHKLYEQFGGEGVGVCERWSEFYAFFHDMGPCPSGNDSDLVLVRLDITKDFCPENCSWSPSSSSLVTSRSRIEVAPDGSRLPITELARRHGLSVQTLRARLNAGWDMERALTTEPRRKRTQSDG